jgi:Glycosyltransferase
MKIGFVRRGYSSTGGAEAYLLRLASAVAGEGHAPVLIGSGGWPEGVWPGEFVVRVNGDSPSRFAREAARATEGCDVVFSMERILDCDVYRAGDGVHRAWLDRRARFEPAWRRWTRWTNSKHRELLALEARMFSPEHTRRVIANSRMVRDEIVRIYGYPEERIDVIPNGYDAPDPRPEWRMVRREELGIGADAFVALFAGSGWERKGLQTAIEAVERSPFATLLVAGKGTPQGTPERVKFLGPRKGLVADFAAADVFVLPTIYDPFSNACLEALAAGLPVVTTTANGFAEIIDDGVHGSIVEPGDVAALAQRLEFWRTHAAAARGRCRERAAQYTEAENCRQTLETILKAREAPVSG